MKLSCHSGGERSTTRLAAGAAAGGIRVVSRLLFLGTLAWAGVGHAWSGTLPDRVDFNFQIRPILSDRCYKCHGPDTRSRKAGLRLDTAGGAQGVIRPGQLGESELYRRIRATDPEERMPPPQSKLKLSEQEIGLIGRWIEQGAEWKKHWSLQVPERAAIPEVRLAAWPRNAIDHFILSRLEREGVEPASEACPPDLIRRLSFDLTGLPPTPAEVDEFCKDSSPEAYALLVDRLLSRVDYGERMAVDWLDLARYSDSYGYQVDRDRFVWPWRDWVIRAFNENMPYDQFVTWQLAGDLFPEPTEEQVLATTFNRLHPQKVEGGSVPEEFRVEYVADRTHTFGTAFLGLTIECMRCHDHKYDPFTQKEYYQLFAFFNNIDEAGLYSYFTTAVPTPTLLLTDPSERERVDHAEQEIHAAEQTLAELAHQRRDAFEIWLSNRPSDPAWAGELGHFPFDSMHGGQLENRLNPDQPAHSSEANRIVPGKIGNAVSLTGDDGVELKFGNFHRYEPFSITLWLNTPDFKERAVVFHRSKAWTDAGSRGYELLIEDGRLSAALIHFWPGNAIRVRMREAIPTNTWLHVAMTYDGSSQADGLRIFVNGQLAGCQVVRDHLFKNITGGGGDNLAIGERMRDRGFARGLVDEFRVFNRELTALEVAELHDGESLRKALQTPVPQLSLEQRAGLREYYLAVIDEVGRQRLAALQEARARRSKAADDLREIMVMRELPPDLTRPTFLLQRGAYDAPGEPVHPDTPAALSPFPADQPTNRLGLARWLTDPRHPLTGRVAVNRLWQLCFGKGLVRTAEDFGSQGELPSHPELLDWLARDFVDSGWDVKRMLKQIVLSATYRQSSAVRPELRGRDPENRWLARFPRYQLPAEMIRDNALAVSGALARRVGGPPAKPYELAASFKPMKPDEGEGLYRRSIYTFWKRTGPAPVMMTLDAAKRDVCAVRRERTATPLQALVLLNDPQMIEAARLFAQHAMVRHGADMAGLLEEMFVAATSRRPTPAETRILERLYEEQHDWFARNREAAETLLKTGAAPWNRDLDVARLAALTILANTLLNLDDCIRKR